MTNPPFFGRGLFFRGGVSILRCIDWRLNNVTFQCSQVWKFLIADMHLLGQAIRTECGKHLVLCLTKRGWEKTFEKPGRIGHFGWKFGLLNTHIIWSQFGIPIGVPSLSTWEQLRFQLRQGGPWNADFGRRSSALVDPNPGFQWQMKV